MSKQLSMIIFTVSFISGVYNETTNEIITGGVGNITVSPFFKILLFLIATVVGLMYLHDVNLFIRMPDNSSVLPHPVFFSFLFDAYLFIYLFICFEQCWSFRYGAKFLLQRKVLSVSVLIATCFYQLPFWLPLP